VQTDILIFSLIENRPKINIVLTNIMYKKNQEVVQLIYNITTIYIQYITIRTYLLVTS